MEKKKLLSGYEDVINHALTFYPELEDIAVEFHSAISPISTFTTVKSTTLKSPPQERVYIVHITEIIKKGREGALMRKAGYDAQVGLIAHELGHVVDFLGKTATQILFTGLFYLSSKRFRRALERKIDEVAIEHGAGIICLPG
jgi:hypothetical protein